MLHWVAQALMFRESYEKFWTAGVTGGSYSPAAGAQVISGSYSTSSDNNPYNIRAIGSAVNYKGVTGQKEGFRGTASIGYFLVFDTLNNGVRAGMYNLLYNYFYSSGNYNTVSKIINKYAPSSDGNSTATYIANVTARMKAGLVGTKYANMTDSTTLSIVTQDSDADNVKMFKELNKAILESEGGGFAKSTVDSFDFNTGFS